VVAGFVAVLVSEGIGAFLVCGLLILAAGATGLFAGVMDRIPVALLAGVLAHFAFDAFAAGGTEAVLVGAMFAAYLAGRRWWPRWAVPGVLAAGVAVAAGRGQLDTGAVQWSLVHPVFTAPRFSLTAVVFWAIVAGAVTLAVQRIRR
jgi:benzoate membrane transport protein